MKHLSKNDWLNIEREYCSRSLAAFAKQAWHVLEPGTELKWGWCLDAICLHLEAVTDGRIKRLLMNVPPGSMKSLLTGVIWPAWEWAKNASLRIVGTAHEETLAIRDSRKCRDLIKSDWYQNLWPLSLASDLDGKREFGNQSKGVRQARAFTSMTGVRGDRIILDDPISADNANSDAKLLAVKIAFTETLPTRINNSASAIVVIMQRLNEKDVSGIILDLGLDYCHLRIPMRFEIDSPCETSIGWKDPRTVDGELMFPERFPEEDIKALELSLGSYATAGQLQQRPAPRSGGMFKRAWFNPVRELTKGIVFCRGWDLAATDNKDAAYTAGVKVGRYPDGRFVIAHSTRDQTTSGGAERMIVNTAKMDGDGCKISLPQDPGQAGKAQGKYLVRQLAGFNARATPETGDKEVRADPLSAQCEAGNVDILIGEWNEDFLDEICTFPSSKFKDQVDAASRAFNELILKKRPTAFSGTHGTSN